MRKLFLILAASALVLASCDKQAPTDETPVSKLAFNFTVNHPDASTKAVKTGWEVGDAVYVVFSNLSTSNYLQMSYDGSSWTTVEMTGKEEATSFLTLPESGNLTALYLPFGNDGYLSKSGSWQYYDQDNEAIVIFSYYMSCEGVEFTNVDGVVSATLDMKIPQGYVQFFMEDGLAESDPLVEATLSESHLQLNGFMAIMSTGKVLTTLGSGNTLPGFAYNKAGENPGYLFSGILAASYRDTPTDYSFTYHKEHTTLGNEWTYKKDIPGGVLYTSENTGRAIKFNIENGWTEVTDGDNPWDEDAPGTL